MISIFEKLIRKEIQVKQRNVRLFAILLMISFIASFFRLAKVLLSVYNRYKVYNQRTAKGKDLDAYGV